MRLIHRTLATACLLVVSCGNDPEEQALERFAASRRAIASGDLNALKALIAAEHAAQFEGPAAAMALEMAQAAMPRDLRVVETSFADAEGTLTITGTQVMDDGATKLAIPARGTVRMVREADGWKIAEEDWSVQLDRATPIFDVRTFVQEGQRPAALVVLEGHASGATEIVYTPNWKYLVTISYGDFSLRVWDIEAGRELAARTLGSRPTSLAVSSGGEALYTASVDGDVARWPLDTLGQLGEPEVLLRDAGQHAALSPDGRFLAVTSYDAPVVIYDVSTASPVRTLEGSEKLRSTTFSPSGELLVGSEGNELMIWRAKSWSAKSYSLDDVSADSSNGRVAFSSDGRYLGVPCGDGSIIVFDVEKRRVEHNFFVSGAAASSIQFSPDASQFATAQNNQQINVWSMADHERVGYILSKKSNATALRFSPDGRYLIAGHEDRQIVFWGVPTADEQRVELARPGGGAMPPELARAERPERVALLGQTNYLGNPDANQHRQFWQASGDVAIEECAAGDPCFVTRWDGKLVGSATLPGDAAGRYMLLIGSAAAERAHDGFGDQTGEAYIHGYGEPLDPHLERGRHYSAPTLQTETRKPNTWTTLWGVFPVDEHIRRIQFEIRQSDGRSAKDGSASRFDDLGVYLFDTQGEAESFVARYERAVGRVAGAPTASAPAAPSAAERTPREASARPGAAITGCTVDGRVVFMSQSQCAQLSAGR